MNRWILAAVVLGIAAVVSLALLLGSPKSESNIETIDAEQETRPNSAGEITSIRPHEIPEKGPGGLTDRQQMPVEQAATDDSSATTAGLRESPVSASLPILESEDYAGREPPPNGTATPLRQVTTIEQASSHPLDPRSQVTETGDGPRGPRPIAPDPGMPGPALLPAADSAPLDSLDVDPTTVGDGSAVLGPGELNRGIDLSGIQGPEQGTPDPESPGPEGP